VAIEIAKGRVSVVEVGGMGAAGLDVSACGSERLPDDAIQPAISGVNVPDPAIVSAAIARACEKAGIRLPRKAALVVPDSVARVSLLSFEELPTKAADVEQLMRWQIKKALPFPVDEALVAPVVTHRAPGATSVAAVASHRDVIAQYEAALTRLNIHAGLVDISSFNVLNAVLSAGTAPTGDWLLLCLAPESTALAIVRQGTLAFYRHRLSVDDEPLGALVHQTAMYHVDRLGGTSFSRVYLCGAAWSDRGEAIRREVSDRLGVQTDVVDVRTAATLRDRITPAPDVLDALAAPLGVLLRERRVA
jgi:Tfp pilus assembly PilM family ATPase